jgi:AAA+ superfamily predicted ATPase
MNTIHQPNRVATMSMNHFDFPNATLLRESLGTIHVAAIVNEIDWFVRVLDFRFTNYFSPDPSEMEIDCIEPPDLTNDRSHYAALVRDYNLTYDERLTILLAAMPHLRPNLLDVFFTKNAHFDRPFSEFGGAINKKHSGFIPTAQTLYFLLGKGAVENRFRIEVILNASHALVMNDFVRLEQTETSEPFLSRALLTSEEFVNYLFTGKLVGPETSEAFPAKRVTTHLLWDDLVVSNEVREEIALMKQWINSEHELMQCNVFRKHMKPGYRALFYGPPGTGKTLTACLVGKSTNMDVYRVDLSLIVSKYIGETEKNLARLFDLAEKKKWILFFDEADALFGKRTQTSSSNDRYANQEVSYLLQRIEYFPGVIILASNLKANMDEAFSRRFQSTVYFSMPDAPQRLILWRQFFTGHFQAAANLQLEQIAEKYELSGGSAINVFRYAVLRAASRQSNQIERDDMIRGLQKEYQKYGKTINS